MKQKVLFIGELNKSLPEYADFTQKFECVDYELTTADQLIDDLTTKFHDVLAIYGAWLGFMMLGGFKDKILENAPESLKVVSICSVGYDGYDGQQMAKRGIILTNVPSDGACNPVAELVLYNAISSFRNFKVFQDNLNLQNNHTVWYRKNLQSGSFDSKSGQAQIATQTGYDFGEYALGRGNSSPRNHNAVIVGFGKIGQTIGQRLSDIGMNIHYVKRSKLTADAESALNYPVTYHQNVTEVKDVADLIIIACPGTPETKHMINAEVIDTISKPFRIINIGRGSVIDEQALVDGLQSGKVLFAGLDVFEDEPRIHEQLFNRQDVVLTPHIGASTVENFDYTAISAMKNIENVLLHGGQGLSKVN